MNSAFLDKATGIPLAQCLSELVANKPRDPIEWIAHWLYRYSDTEMYFYEKSLFNKEMALAKHELKQERLAQRRRIECTKNEIQERKNDIYNAFMTIAELKKSLGIKSSKSLRKIYYDNVKEDLQSKMTHLTSAMQKRLNLLNVQEPKPRRRRKERHSDSSSEYDEEEEASSPESDSEFEESSTETTSSSVYDDDDDDDDDEDDDDDDDDRKDGRMQASPGGQKKTKRRTERDPNLPDDFDPASKGRKKRDGSRKTKEERAKEDGGRRHKKRKDGSVDSEDGGRREERVKEDGGRRHKKRKDGSVESEDGGRREERVKEDGGRRHKKRKDGSVDREDGGRRHKTRKDGSVDREDGGRRHKTRKDGSVDSDEPVVGAFDQPPDAQTGTSMTLKPKAGRKRFPTETGRKSKRRGKEGAQVNTDDSESSSYMTHHSLNSGEEGGSFDYQLEGHKSATKYKQATWCLDCNLGLVCDHPILGLMSARCTFVHPESPERWESQGFVAEALYDPEVYSTNFELPSNKDGR